MMDMIHLEGGDYYCGGKCGGEDNEDASHNGQDNYDNRYEASNGGRGEEL